MAAWLVVTAASIEEQPRADVAASPLQQFS
jgi:hypothetical protein